MKIPSELKIKGETWKVSFEKRLALSGELLDGLTDNRARTIQIAKSLKGFDRDHTFLHEYLHACIHELHADLDIGTEEVLVDGIAKCLLDTFRMRPK